MVDHQDFLGFTFDGIHTNDLQLKVVVSSNRYTNRTLPTPTDQTVEVPGGDGTYYFGQIYKNREFTCNLAFDSVTEQIFRKIRQLFSNDKLCDLVFDEEPFKHWRAKISSAPEFKYICFTDKDSGQRVYKGEGTLKFKCYFPYAFGFDKYVVTAADYYLTKPPECIINDNENEENYFINSSRNKNYGRILPEDIKYHYNTNPSNYVGGEGDTSRDLRDEPHQNRTGYLSYENYESGETIDRYWDPNDKTVWKTGFPTIEQVQGGELYFDTDFGEKSIVDVRGYWENVPEWEGTAKLLTTPTLDYEQELMYMPQYSKVDFINTDIGYNNYRPMIGTRVLVYNPGDLPIEWEIKFNENKRAFWSCRGGEKFRIRRFNVERLSIPNAVDWCGLTTYDPDDDTPFKYGSKYFRRRYLDRNQLIQNIKDYYSTIVDDEVVYFESIEDDTVGKVWFVKSDSISKAAENLTTSDYYTVTEIITIVKEGHMVADKHWQKIWNNHWSRDEEDYSWQYEDWNTSKSDYKAHRDGTDEDWTKSLKVAFNLHTDVLEAWFDGVLKYDLLGEAHPHHCYYVEPIPRQRMAHFIKLFYWQTIQWRGNKTVTGEWVNTELWKDMMPDSFWQNSSTKTTIADMSHPLVNFVRMFYHVSENGVIGDRVDTFREKLEDLDFEDGITFANRYQKCFDQCISPEEEYELYWDTLRKLLSNFEPMLEDLESGTYDSPYTGSDGAYSIEDFIYDFINCPAEYISSDTRDLDYDSEVFNAFKYPEWTTEDYIEIDQSEMSGVDLITQYLAAIEEDPDAVFIGRQIYYDSSLLGDSYSTLKKKLDEQLGDGGCLNDLLDDKYYFNSETRMLYATENPYGMEFTYKPSKNIMNDAITKGKWFKLPSGWSMLAIEPVMDESLWGGKRWRDARPYDWGYGGDINSNKREVQQLFDLVNVRAREEFFDTYKSVDEIKVSISHSKYSGIVSEDNALMRKIEPPQENYDYQNLYSDAIIKRTDNVYGSEDNIDEWLKFKVWYETNLNAYPAEENYFAYSIYKKRQQNAEYTYLKMLDEIWQMISPYYSWTSLKGVYFDPDTGLAPQNSDYDVMGLPLRCINGDISDWWWYACNYCWALFPPLYWALADLLNNIQIKYIPLFY